MNWGLSAGLSSLAYAFWALFWRIGTSHYSWKDILFFAAVGEMSLVLIVFWPAKMPPLPAVGWGLAAGLCAMVGYSFFAMALGSAKSSLPVVVMSMYPVVVLVLASLFLHEAFSWEKWLGVGLAMVGVWLVVK